MHQTWQDVQPTMHCSGRATTALLFSGSKSNTFLPQLVTQMPQPVHLFLSTVGCHSISSLGIPFHVTNFLSSFDG